MYNTVKACICRSIACTGAGQHQQMHVPAQPSAHLARELALLLCASCACCSALAGSLLPLLPLLSAASRLLAAPAHSAVQASLELELLLLPVRALLELLLPALQYLWACWCCHQALCQLCWARWRSVQVPAP